MGKRQFGVPLTLTIPCVTKCGHCSEGKRSNLLKSLPLRSTLSYEICPHYVVPSAGLLRSDRVSRISFGSRQVVRQRPLEPSFEGSIPSSRTIFSAQLLSTSGAVFWVENHAHENPTMGTAPIQKLSCQIDHNQNQCGPKKPQKNWVLQN